MKPTCYYCHETCPKRLRISIDHNNWICPECEQSISDGFKDFTLDTPDNP